VKDYFEEWLYYLKKEQEATIGSTRVIYARLKELHRDRVVARHTDTSVQRGKIVEFLDEQIKKNEEKLAILMNLEVDLPEFYD
jgi:hypothetical protein